MQGAGRRTVVLTLRHVFFAEMLVRYIFYVVNKFCRTMLGFRRELFVIACVN